MQAAVQQVAPARALCRARLAPCRAHLNPSLRVGRIVSRPGPAEPQQQAYVQVGGVIRALYQLSAHPFLPDGSITLHGITHLQPPLSGGSAPRLRNCVAAAGSAAAAPHEAPMTLKLPVYILLWCGTRARRRCLGRCLEVARPPWACLPCGDGSARETRGRREAMAQAARRPLHPLLFAPPCSTRACRRPPPPPKPPGPPPLLDTRTRSK